MNFECGIWCFWDEIGEFLLLVVVDDGIVLFCGGDGMGKQTWKAGNMLYPLPVVMVSVADCEGHDNIITVAWAGTVCTNPPMVSISVRPERFSHHMLMESKEFVINLTTEDLAFATDFCGVKSGKEVDK